MKTTELFDFRFVDRTKEGDVLNNFFLNEKEKTLWIKGESGFGKTTFFNHMLSQWRNYNLCYINVGKDNNKDTVISHLITELEKHVNISFIDVIKNNYKYFYNNIYKYTKGIANIFFPKIEDFISAILDLEYITISWKNEHKNSIELITEYIRLILKDKKLCICIDNFSRCDSETADIFFQIFKLILPEENFRSCIITTTEDLQEELSAVIYQRLSLVEIQISKFKEYTYFYEIMRPNFNVSNLEPSEIKFIYDKCKGSPKKLSTIISKLLEKDGIILDASPKQAEIKKDILFSILQTEDIHFRENDFSPPQKWIIFSYLCLSEQSNIENIEELALYISKKAALYSAYDVGTFQVEINNLVNNKVLSYNVDNMIAPCHDADYEDLKSIFKASQIKGLFSQYAYEFLKSHRDYPERKRLLCHNAREADIDGWEQMNFFYGKSLAKNKHFYNAQKYFSYLSQGFYKLHMMQKLFIALNSYETGNYQLAINQLSTLQPSALRFNKAKYCYYFYLGKSYYNIGRVSKGTDALEKALQEVPVDSEEYVQILNVLHMYYFEIPEKIEKSKEIFNKIRQTYRSIYPIIWANTMRGCHNFLDNEEAIEVLQEAESILDSEVEKAYVKTTLGFVFVKMDRLDCAQSQFESACETIKKLKIHEYSYAANNLALCYMLNKNYQKAKEILIEALIWNKTHYGYIVLQNHLMICSLYLKQKDEVRSYQSYLYDYIENKRPKDPIMNRKIYINLAIVSGKLNEPLIEKNLYNKAGAYVKNTTSEWRYKVHTKQYEDYEKEAPHTKYMLEEDFDPWFLVYAHD